MGVDLLFALQNQGLQAHDRGSLYMFLLELISWPYIKDQNFVTGIMHIVVQLLG